MDDLTCHESLCGSPAGTSPLSTGSCHLFDGVEFLALPAHVYDDELASLLEQEKTRMAPMPLYAEGRSAEQRRFLVEWIMEVGGSPDPLPCLAATRPRPVRPAAASACAPARVRPAPIGVPCRSSRASRIRRLAPRWCTDMAEDPPPGAQPAGALATARLRQPTNQPSTDPPLTSPPAICPLPAQTAEEMMLSPHTMAVAVTLLDRFLATGVVTVRAWLAGWLLLLPAPTGLIAQTPIRR